MVGKINHAEIVILDIKEVTARDLYNYEMLGYAAEIHDQEQKVYLYK